MTLLPWLITLLVVALLATFIGYLISLRALPTDGRPRKRTYNRYGEFIAERENPDYHENPGEDAAEDPGTDPGPTTQETPRSP
jgi:hypothetical protein